MYNIYYNHLYGEGRDTAMKRKLTNKLIQWKNQGVNRLPLIINGARQVGKTYTVEDFGNQFYKNIVYINFEQNPALRTIFDEDLSPERIVRLLEIYSGKSIVPIDTLIFFDEIQACDRALTSLKYFAEAANEFHVIAAGSLLGVALNREKVSFPVGKVQMETLRSLDFEEFLWAIDKKELAEEIRRGFQIDRSLIGLLHEQAIELYRVYLCTGGMPAVVSEYRNSNKLFKIPEIQNNIINAYIADMAKYATASETVKVRTAFDSMPAQLAKENKKFQYKILKKGASASHFGVAVDWLCSSGIILQCKRIDHGKMPPAAYVDLSAFKLYMADTGLLLAKAGIPVQNIILNTANADDFKGAITENYVAQALVSSGYDLYYWESDSRAEVDFIIVRDGQVVPIEVKAAINNKSKSLGVYVDRYKPPYSIRISARNFGFENGIKSIPLYAVFAI
jgi:predicted AAA+ superfamily ATPase